MLKHEKPPKCNFYVTKPDLKPENGPGSNIYQDDGKKG